MQQEPHNVIIPKRLVSATAVYKGKRGKESRREGSYMSREPEQMQAWAVSCPKDLLLSCAFTVSVTDVLPWGCLWVPAIFSKLKGVAVWSWQACLAG